MRDGTPDIVPCPAFKRGGITRRMGGTCKRFGKTSKGWAAWMTEFARVQAYGFLCGDAV